MEEVTRCHDQIRGTRALRRIGDEQLAAARVMDGKVHAASLDPPPTPRKYLPAGAPVILDPPESLRLPSAHPTCRAAGLREVGPLRQATQFTNPWAARRFHRARVPL